MIPCTRVLPVPSFLKERTMMLQRQRLIRLPLVAPATLFSLGGAYLVALGRSLCQSMCAPSDSTSEHVAAPNAGGPLKCWTVASMGGATDAGLLTSQASDLSPGSAGPSAGTATQQPGQLARDEGLP